MNSNVIVGILTALCVSITVLAANGYASTLDHERAAGTLRCGINPGLPGFYHTDDRGRWSGFEASYCQALASGEVDILSRNTTWTFARDADLGLTFVGINYYDGQGFIGHRELGVESATELDGASICIQTGTTTELNLADFFRVNAIAYEPVPIETNAEARSAYEAERCDVYTTDVSGLAATKSTFDDPDSHVIYPEIISKEPLGPLVRHGDDQWADIGRWC